MRNGENQDDIAIDLVDQVERKLRENEPSDLGVDLWRHMRILENALIPDIDLVEKQRAESGALRIVAVRCVVEFAVSVLVNLKDADSDTKRNTPVP